MTMALLYLIICQSTSGYLVCRQPEEIMIMKGEGLGNQVIAGSSTKANLSVTVSSASLQKTYMCKWLGEDITSNFSLSVCLML